MITIATAVVAAMLAAAGAKPDTKPDTLHRFFDLQLALLETRYRYVEDSAGVTTSNQWQHKESVRGAFKFDAQGRYTVQAFVGTGNGFTASWDPTGVGTGDPTWDLHVRRLWARAVPVDGLELSAGSFDVLRGETTEIVSYDNDAYMEGYRASLKRPAKAFFDEISVTAGYFGDLSEPNVFERFKWMDNHNYTQALVVKRVSNWFAASVDWTSVDHVDTIREGARIGTKDLIPGVIDDMRVQAYQRTDSPTGTGLSAEAERIFSTRATVYGGYSHVDRDNPLLNGDRYGLGHRLYGGGSLNLLPELMLAVFYTHALSNDYPIGNHQRLDIVLSYNVLKALQQHHAW